MPPLKTRCIVVDIDGTLSDLRHRVHHVNPKDRPEGFKPDWNAFNNAMHLDAPKQDVIDLVNLVYLGAKSRGGLSPLTGSPYPVAIVLLTGRLEEYRRITYEWLSDKVKFNFLYMRPSGDYRPDEVIKEEILDNIILPRWEVVAVIDDRDKVVAMWRRRGLTCFQVQSGDY